MRRTIGNRQLAPDSYRDGKAFSSRRCLLILFLIISSLVLHTSYLFAQPPTATATLDTNAILIGQKTKITLRVDYRADQGEMKIDFPKTADTLIKQIEVVQKSKIEKIIPDSSDMNRLAQVQTLYITSFDSGYYAIPPFHFIVNGDTGKPIETEPLLFTVNTLPIDTTRNIKDIKPPLEVPFSWRELLPYAYEGLGGVAILAGLILLIRYYLKKRKKQPAPPIIVPKIPPHVTALEQLEKLKEQKLWQQGKLKEYHSALSDIMRQYIEHRFYIHAMEQVTDEIMYSFKSVDLSDDLKMKLRQILFLSDLVKFAKEQPLPNENEMSWNSAVEFISATKPAEAPASSPPSQPNTHPQPTPNES